MTVETRRSAETGPVSTPALWPTLVPRTQFVTSDPTVSLATVLLGSLGIHLQIVILVSMSPEINQCDSEKYLPLITYLPI